jgi:hypothetical protein
MLCVVRRDKLRCCSQLAPHTHGPRDDGQTCHTCSHACHRQSTAQHGTHVVLCCAVLGACTEHTSPSTTPSAHHHAHSMSKTVAPARQQPQMLLVPAVDSCALVSARAQRQLILRCHHTRAAAAGSVCCATTPCLSAQCVAVLVARSGDAHKQQQQQQQQHRACATQAVRKSSTSTQKHTHTHAHTHAHMRTRTHARRLQHSAAAALNMHHCCRLAAPFCSALLGEAALLPDAPRRDHTQHAERAAQTQRSTYCTMRPRAAPDGTGCRQTTRCQRAAALLLAAARQPHHARARQHTPPRGAPATTVC